MVKCWNSGGHWSHSPSGYRGAMNAPAPRPTSRGRTPSSQSYKEEYETREYVERAKRVVHRRKPDTD